jgi:hypothetical protein
MGIFARLFGKRETGKSAGVVDVIAADSVADEYEYMEANKCACGGKWELDIQAARHGSAPGIMIDQMDVHCSNCGQKHAFRFAVDTQSAAYQRALAEALGELEQDLDDDK